MVWGAAIPSHPFGQLRALEHADWSPDRDRLSSKYPDWTLQMANIPATITCSDVMAEKHPELAVAFVKGMIRVGRWANEHKHAAAVILDKQTYWHTCRVAPP